MMEKVTAKQVESVILGVAVGDALGVPVEFKKRGSFHVTGMVGHGTHDQPPGTWSDDTSLALCLSENIVEGGDETALMQKFLEYLRRGYMTPYGECFDIGITTSRAIEAYRSGEPAIQCGQAGEDDNGNGSLMRIAPVVFLVAGEKDFSTRAGIVAKWSKITHAHPRSILGCIIYVEMLRQILIGKGKLEGFLQAVSIVRVGFNATPFESEIPEYSRVLGGKGGIHQLPIEAIRSGGYVVNTLEAALWCFLTTDTYRDAVLKAVNLGGDTDTTAAVTGGLAGLYYGVEGIPPEWASALARLDDIKELCRKLAGAVADSGRA